MRGRRSGDVVVARYPVRCCAPPHPELLERWRSHRRGPEGVLHTLLAPLAGDDIPIQTHRRARGRGDGVIYPPGEAAARTFAGAAPGAPAGPRTVRAIVVAAQFSDVALTQPASHFNDLFFSTGRTVPTGSVREYYEEASRGTVLLVGDVVGPVTVPNTLAHYANHTAGQGASPNTQDFAADVLAAIGPRPYAAYDNDGDGYVDAFIIVHAGRGAEFTGSKNDLWSLKWTLATAPVVGTDGTKVYAFLTVPEDTPMGIAAHELGHLLFQLPDLYDISHRSNGIGNWCLMAGGCWNGGGNTPAHLSAWCKNQLKWTTPLSVAATTKVTFSPNSVAGGQTLNLRVAGSEYVLVENRSLTGFDAALPGEGLLIWHVDDSRPDNTYPNFKVSLIQADGLTDLESAVNNGDPGDPYPGATTNVSFGAHSTPAFVPYSGAVSTIALANIAAASPNVTADCTP